MTTPGAEKKPSSSTRDLRTILLVDERDSSRLVTKWFLGAFGYVVHSARSAEEALSMFAPEVHDLVITGARQWEDDLLSVPQCIKHKSPRTPIVVFSAVPPSDPSCVDALVARPGHLLLLKNAIDEIAHGERAAESQK